MTDTKVAKASTTEVGAVKDFDFKAMAGAGAENITNKDIIIPRLTILQSLSPQLNKKKSEYIEGSSAGDICDVATGEFFEGEVEFLLCHFETMYLEWAPRETGKGLLAIHLDPLVEERATKTDSGALVNEAGNLIQKTYQFYGLNVTAGGRPCFIPMASTQLKVGRKWNTMVKACRMKDENGEEFDPPTFHQTYRLKSSEEANAKGEWFSWQVIAGTPIQELEDAANLWRKCIELGEQMKSGAARADTDHFEQDQDTSGEAAM